MNILMIGNGFDLAHGLPTKYGDFLLFAKMVKKAIEIMGIEKVIPTNDKEYKEQEIKDMFKNVRSNMEVFKFNKKPEIKDGSHYSISVYGADKAGIVHAITKEITKNNLNIIDLQTKITGGSTKVYIMMLEVVANNEDNENIWQEALKKTAKEINTQINIKKIEFYEL